MDTKESSQERAMGNTKMKMVMCTMGNGVMIRNMEVANKSTLMDQFTSANGRMEIWREKES
jgi:hypothetical protein